MSAHSAARSQAATTSPPAAALAARSLIDVGSLSRPCEIAFARGSASPGTLQRMVRAAVHAVLAVVEWPERTRAQRLLLSLDERTLRDLGLSRHDIRRL